MGDLLKRNSIQWKDCKKSTKTQNAGSVKKKGREVSILLRLFLVMTLLKILPIAEYTKNYRNSLQVLTKGAFQKVAWPGGLWAVEIPPTARSPGFCPTNRRQSEMHPSKGRMADLKGLGIISYKWIR